MILKVIKEDNTVHYVSNDTKTNFEIETNKSNAQWIQVIHERVTFLKKNVTDQRLLHSLRDIIS